MNPTSAILFLAMIVGSVLLSGFIGHRQAMAVKRAEARRTVRDRRLKARP